MAAQQYLMCTCGHKDVMHTAAQPHECRVTECECLNFLSTKTAQALSEEGEGD